MPTTADLARAEGAPIIPFDHHSPEWAARHIEMARGFLEQTPVA